MSLIIRKASVYAELGDSTLSKLIARITAGNSPIEVSHVGLFTRKTCDEPDCVNPAHWMVTQALAPGIVTITLAASMNGAAAAYCLDDPTLDEASREKIVNYALGQQGIQYATV